MKNAPDASLRIAYGLNEGPACYFQFMKIKKDGSIIQKDNTEYLSSVKSLIEIDEFKLDD